MSCIGADRISAFHNAVLNIGIISEIYVIQNDRILYNTVISNKHFLEKN